MSPRRWLSVYALIFSAGLTPQILHAQGGPPPPVSSPEVAADGKVTLRMLAPNATKVSIVSSDMPGVGRGAEMTKGERGVWEIIFDAGELPAGAYRYNFLVDDVTVIDPRNPITSESNANVSSLVVVPGSKVFDTLDVPHGAVAELTYHSKSLNAFRRAHVYTPPGYEKGEGRYPVFYLLHGASDSDDSWSSVGRAGIILDNLIAAGKAKPMIVVMPNGHVGTFGFGQGNSFEKQMAGLVDDFNSDLQPLIEKNYRVIADRDHRAIAGLSMGGAQTLDISIPRLKDFGYIGVFSSGIFGIVGNGPGAPQQAGPSWEERHKAELDNAATRDGVKLVWFATGNEDFLVQTSRATVDMLKKHGFKVVYEEGTGGHTWLNWRDYLAALAPKLFQN